MKMLVTGAAHTHGTKKINGAPYSMAMVFCNQPIEDVDSANYNKVGHGFEPVSIACEPSVVSILKSQKLPAIIDLLTDMRLRMGKLEPYIVGVNAQ